MFEVVTADTGGFGSWHGAEAAMLFADGGGKLMSTATDLEVLIPLGDRSDGQLAVTSDPMSDRRARNILLRRAARQAEPAP